MSKTMKAAVLHKTGTKLAIEKLPIPVPGPGDRREDRPREDAPSPFRA